MNAQVHQDTNGANSYQIEQSNYVQILVENYNNDLLALQNTLNNINAINGTSRELLAVCGTTFTHASEGMLKHLLLVEYWGRVYQRSNISAYLDSKKRKEYEKSFQLQTDNKTTFPEFTEVNILSTLKEWYADRENMFMERIDLVFQSLSRDHVTNVPEGFSKKMIFGNGCEFNYSSDKEHQSLTTNTANIIHDLACCIALILKQPIPAFIGYNVTGHVPVGERIEFYGGFFELQVFKNRSVHLWIHPSLAIDLNIWLAKKYPTAIPSSLRTKTSNIPDFQYKYEMLSGEELEYIRCVDSRRTFVDSNKFSKKTKERFAKYVGLSQTEIEEISYKDRGRLSNICSDLMRCGYPNIKDHQYYPTPDNIIEDLKRYLGDRVASTELEVLEPSAGSGKLARLFNPKRVTCVEVSDFFTSVLYVHGFIKVNRMDFLKYKSGAIYDLIVMNPPYANKRLEKHLLHALTMLKPDGELIVIAPTGKESSIKALLNGRVLKTIAQHEGAFDDTSISTTIFSIS